MQALPGKLLSCRAWRMLMAPSCAGLGTALSYKDFSGKSFPQQKFYKAELRGTNFSGADLTGANLYGAYAKARIVLHQPMNQAESKRLTQRYRTPTSRTPTCG